MTRELCPVCGSYLPSEPLLIAPLQRSTLYLVASPLERGVPTAVCSAQCYALIVKWVAVRRAHPVGDQS